MEHVYLCIHCGTPSKELYKKFSPNALTLQKCVNCLQVIDKYIEYDLTVVFIDVLLLKVSAYRPYVEYVYKKQSTENPSAEPIFYELEWNYYFICLNHFLKLIVFSSTFLLFTFLVSRSLFKAPEYFSYLCILEGLALSYCWKLVTVPSLVWNHYISYSILSQTALFISCIHTFRVCVQPNYLLSTMAVTSAFIMQWSVSQWLVSLNPVME